MEIGTLSINLLAGWFFWSFAHNVGHRWWHDEMRKGKKTFYAHGEREHHRLYDSHDLEAAAAEDPRELFISFPYPVVAAMALVPIAIYAMIFGVAAAIPFAVALYASMTLDHLLHKQFHKREHLPGVLGWFQQLHMTHHATHNRNYFFVTGLVWDVLFRTFRSRRQLSDTRSPGAASQ
jgi:hypothetical protein